MHLASLIKKSNPKERSTASRIKIRGETLNEVHLRMDKIHQFYGLGYVGFNVGLELRSISILCTHADTKHKNSAIHQHIVH